MFNYWFKPWNWGYKVAYGLVSLAMRIFYKKVEVVGLENIPKNGGILFAVNHQNAFMDPIVLATKLEKNIHSLTRADIFKNKRANKILRHFYMLPVFRLRDGVDTQIANKETFNTCYDILNNNEQILIFPEGNHNNQKILRPLKKGIIRIGFSAADKVSYNKHIYIVPIGLNYSNHTNMGATLLINIGKAISLKDYYESYKDKSTSIINSTTNLLKEKMSELMIDIKSNYYKQLQSLMWIKKDADNSINNNSLLNELKSHKEIIKKLENLEHCNPKEFNKLCTNADDFNKFIANNNLHYKLFKNGKKKFSVFFKILFLLIFSPIQFIGLLSNYLPYKLPVVFVNKKVKDLHFHSSIKLILGILLFIIFWGIQTAIVAICFNNYIWIYYLLSLPVLGIFNYFYWILLKKTKGKIKYNNLLKNKKIDAVLENYNKIIKII